jgi:hypothetical protein
LCSEVKKPTGAREEKSEAIGTPGNIIDCGTVHGMNHPKECQEEGGVRRSAGSHPNGRPPLGQRSQNPAQEEIKENAAQHVPENIREVITKRVSIPEKIIEDVRNRLNRSIMARIGIREKIVAKCFPY